MRIKIFWSDFLQCDPDDIFCHSKLVCCFQNQTANREKEADISYGSDI